MSAVTVNSNSSNSSNSNYPITKLPDYQIA
jgi:hypothetical protein